MSTDSAPERGAARRPRRPTSTSTFGVGRREAHDASDFYARFSPPEVSDDETVQRQPVVDEIFCHDARHMDEGHERIKPSSVALVVTSPPYFAGKAYEADLDEDGIPASYLEYLQMLHDVFAACVDKLEPGGRLAVNVANLGRKPYRSLAADVIGILQDDLGLLLRGEIVWRKGLGSSGSCAWGSFQSPANPVLRDLTERVVVASKGRFDRAPSRAKRAETGLPSVSSITKDDFMEATTDVWDIGPERATRVGHPAPFPVELPQRLIELYTYRDDVVLDPFMGSGSTAVAAVRTGRHFVGFDTDRSYVRIAKARVAAARADLDAQQTSARPPVAVRVPHRADADDGSVEAALAAGHKAVEVVARLLEASGFTDVTDKTGLPAAFAPALTALDPSGGRWYVELAGTLTTPRAGLRRTDVLWRTLGRASVLAASVDHPYRLLVVTSDPPAPASPGARALHAVLGHTVHAVVDLLAPDDRRRLGDLVAGG